jgi:hypothetical protein
MREAAQVTKCLLASYHNIADGPNKSLDASGDSASRNLRGAVKGALIRAAASTQTLLRRRFNGEDIECWLGWFRF